MSSVLILSNSDVGLYKFRKELLLELKEHYDVYFCSPEGNYIPELKKLGLIFVNTKIERRGTNLLSDFKLLVSYIFAIKKIRPNIVLSFTIKPNIYGGIACEIIKTPYIANITGLGSAVENKGIMQKITLALYKIALKKANCIFFQNEANEQFFISRKLINCKHIRIPGSGVNLDYYRPLEYPPIDTVHFLFMGRIMREKGIEIYLDAAMKIREINPNTMFHIIGSCEEAYEEKLGYYQKQGFIRYHGMQDDIRGFLKMSHCTIHPTMYPEGMSNVLLESAACGRPIITMDRSGCREIVENGYNGYLLFDKDALVDVISRFLELKYMEMRRMGLNGRKKVEAEFDRRIVVNSYIKEMQRIGM